MVATIIIVMGDICGSNYNYSDGGHVVATIIIVMGDICGGHYNYSDAEHMWWQLSC